MVAQTITIKNEQGLHMRPAGVLSKAAAKYPCDVKLISGDKEVNAKSIMLIIGACLKCGMDVTVQCDGDQEEDALKEIITLFEDGFGE
ncbi:MAG: HPr family phosphocarrier protein [Lachnospiraceae bacterium]|jgi:phosphocarrier protein|nr:HPr family phosphocarrier protein [Lachnospiraceae bacterium]MBQ5560313.1 HPr family phosphocarrier protein [Lachnospiraceae bacterium]MCR4802069.1 HPr family phosphocarrier protein [Lachnospiraceae bacterium]